MSNCGLYKSKTEVVNGRMEKKLIPITTVGGEITWNSLKSVNMFSFLIKKMEICRNIVN